jgi:hypothetical protein
MEVFKINIKIHESEHVNNQEFFLATTLSELAVHDMVDEMVKEMRREGFIYFRQNYMEALCKKYPNNAIIYFEDYKEINF